MPTCSCQVLFQRYYPYVLSDLDLGRTRISGSVTGQLTKLSNLQTLVCDQAQLSGTAPSLGASLKHLNFGSNAISGFVDTGTLLHGGLTVFEFGANRLSGRLV